MSKDISETREKVKQFMATLAGGADKADLSWDLECGNETHELTLQHWQLFIDGIFRGMLVTIYHDHAGYDVYPAINSMSEDATAKAIRGLSEYEEELDRPEADVRLRDAAQGLLQWLGVLLDCLDGPPTEMVGAVVPADVFEKAKAAIKRATMPAEQEKT